MRYTALTLVALAAASAHASAADLSLRVAGNARQLEIDGLSAEGLSRIQQSANDGVDWRGLVQFRFAPPNSDFASEPMWGAYSVEQNRLVFRPRFSLRPGFRYRAEFNRSLPRILEFDDALEVKVAEGPPTPIPQVDRISPSADTLPENLLKFYIEFSQPMARGDAYAHLKLLDAERREVPDPFLELGEELWDPRGQQFTLLFDPGRIKRGVKPNQDMGAPLVAGRSYTLVVKAGWRAASGLPLAEDYEKLFEVGPADRTQPRVDAWTIHPPRADSEDDLRVDLEEPLDRALLGHAISVVDSYGQAVPGEVVIGGPEIEWKLYPRRPWKAGTYRLVVANTLEDLAGNSLGRAFEEQVVGDEPKSADRETYEREFEIDD